MPAPASSSATRTSACSRATASGWSDATAPARRRPSPPWPGSGSRTPARSTSSARSATCPQDPRSGDLDITASDRVLSGRGLDVLRNKMVKAQVAMAEPADDAERDKAVRRYGQLEDQFAALGGYAAESDAARICTNLGLPDRVLAQPLRTLSGGQRRRVELVPHPLLRRRDPAARRADQPPRRRLDHLAQGLPGRGTRAGSSSSATTSSCSTPSSTRCGTSTPTAPRSTSTTSAGSPTCSSARPTSGAASRSGPTPSARSTRCPPRPTRCAPRPPRPGPRRAWTSGPSGWPPVSTPCACRTASPSCGSRPRRRADAPR